MKKYEPAAAPQGTGGHSAGSCYPLGVRFPAWAVSLPDRGKSLNGAVLGPKGREGIWIEDAELSDDEQTGEVEK